MVIVTIVSGPRAGQQNLAPIRPEELFELSRHGWRWEVDWHTVSDAEALEWARHDVMAKVFSALIRGGEVRFQSQVWTASEATLGLVAIVAQQVEDFVSEAGYNVTVGEDTNHYFVIEAVSLEKPPN